MSDVTVAREAFLQALQDAERAVNEANYIATKCEQALARAKAGVQITHATLTTLRGMWEVSTGPNKPGTVEALGRVEDEKYKAARAECGMLGHDWPLTQPQDMAPGTSQTCARCGVTVTQHLRGRTYRWPQAHDGTEPLVGYEATNDPGPRQFMDCRDCATYGKHTNIPGCVFYEQAHLGEREYVGPDGTEGQDRESYSDTQDRDSYEVNDEDTRGDR